MLVIGRRIDEETVMRDARSGAEVCRIKIIGVRDGKVRLGFEAPITTEINRAELDETKQQQKRLMEGGDGTPSREDTES